jgi:hypothetical protein
MTPLHVAAELGADLVEAHGAPRLYALVRESASQDASLCAVADELRRRGRDGLASQVLCCRFDDA